MQICLSLAFSVSFAALSPSSVAVRRPLVCLRSGAVVAVVVSRRRRKVLEEKSDFFAPKSTNQVTSRQNF